MHLLVTPALTLSDAQRTTLEKNHTLHFLSDERIPLSEQTLNFDPADIEGIVCNVFFVYNEMDALPSLKVVQLTSAGLDRLPLNEMRRRRIAVFNAGATYAVPMAEWAIAKVLELVKCADFFRDNQNAHAWNKHRSLREICGMTAAIVGFGNVGRAIATRLSAFGVRITAVDIEKPNCSTCDEWVPIEALNSVLQTADIVILTLPLTDTTHHIMNTERFALMKNDAVLVNVARGALIDEAALIDTLKKGHLHGVALDVFEQEPLPADHPLWDCDRVLLSPHNSFVGEGNQVRLFELIKSNLAPYSN